MDKLILNHLSKFGYITKSIAATKYHVFNVRTVISELKSKGHKITTMMIPVVNSSSYARYVYRGAKK